MGTNEDVVKLILGITTEECRKSCLQLAVTEVEAIIGGRLENCDMTRFSLRNVDWCNEPFAKINRNEESFYRDVFTVLTLCMIILDQLGHIFTVSKRSVRIQELLKIQELMDIRTKYSLADNDISVLSNLRNSLNHNFGLASTGKNNHHKFLICLNEMKELIAHPQPEWKGDWNDKRQETSVKINAFMFISFVGEVLNKICELVEEGKLNSTLQGEELKTRFTILVS